MFKREKPSELDKMYGSIETHFRITSLPEGNAPVEIRRQWLDVSLPVRQIHVARFMNGYIGRRMLSVPEDFVYVDAISGERPRYNDWPIEVRGVDAVDSLVQAGREEAAEYWKPYALGLLSFRHYEGIFEDGRSA